MSANTVTHTSVQNRTEAHKTLAVPHDATRATNETRVVMFIVAAFLVYVVVIVHYLNVVFLNS